MRIGYIGKHRKHRRLHVLLGRILPLLLAALIVWLFAEPKLLDTEFITLSSDELDAGSQLRIVYVSDIHYGSWPYLSMNDVRELISAINSQKPDLVLLGGDYADSAENAPGFFDSLPTIRSAYGVYAVIGEHDRRFQDDNLNELKASMRRRGIIPLINETVSVRVGQKNVTIAGLDDLQSGQPQLKELAAACKGTDLVLFMGHDPAIVDEALRQTGADGHRNWFDIGLFGHTHGGQSPIGRLTGAPAATTGYSAGWYTPNRLAVLVSRGAGTTGLPVRLGCRPQLHVITVKSTATGDAKATPSAK